MPSVAACLIVRDEARVIRRCLDSVRGLVQAVFVVDTGSTDGTLDVLAELQREILLFVRERPWVDFGHNRTEALRLASTAADYLLVLDADQTAGGTIPPDLTADAYALRTRFAGGLEYRAPLLLRSSLPWRCEGATHEYLVCEQASPAVPLDSLVITEHADSSRRRSGRKLPEDAELLERRVAENPKDARAVFYLARTYDDLAASRPDDPKVDEWRVKMRIRYRARAEMEGFVDEAYYSLYRLGAMNLAAGSHGAILTLLQAWQRCPHRWEPVCAAAQWLNRQDLHCASYALTRQALSKPARMEGLFVSPDVYGHGLLLERSISAYYVGAYRESLEACETLLARPLPPHVKAAVERNAAFPREKLAKGG